MRIACVLAGEFEDSEFRVPYNEFGRADHLVTVIGADKGQQLDGEKGTVTITTEAGIDEVRADDFDALFIPGGHSPDQLRGDGRFVHFVQGFSDKPIFAICHGPQLLITAKMVEGRTLTSWRTVQVDLENAGAHVVDREVVVDGKLVTSRQPSDLDAFVRESLAQLEPEPTGRGEHPTRRFVVTHPQPE